MFAWIGKTAALTALALITAVMPASAEAHRHCPLPVFGPGSQYHPQLKPSHFTANVTNPWFPLKPYAP